MKTSNLKTQISFEEVNDFIVNKLDGLDKVERLVEGHISQVFAFKNNSGTKQILRLAQKDTGFQRDSYAYKNFASIKIPIPKIYKIGKFNDDAFYCVSEFVDGTTSDTLSDNDMKNSLKNQLETFAEIYKIDIRNTSGWGDIDIKSGNASEKTWSGNLINQIESIDEELLINGLKSIDIDSEVFSKLKDQFYKNMKDLPEPKRRLIHGDLGFDNVLVENENVVAVLDWDDFRYGDWVFEYTKFDFWWSGRYQDINEFGKEYKLDCENISERINASIAFKILTIIEGALLKESTSTMEWLKTYLPHKLKF